MLAKESDLDEIQDMQCIYSLASEVLISISGLFSFLCIFTLFLSFIPISEFFTNDMNSLSPSLSAVLFSSLYLTLYQALKGRCGPRSRRPIYVVAAQSPN